MTARIDIGAVKSRLTVPTVLRAHGHTPRHGRMPCPLHGGDNRSAFSIQPGDRYARCWACGWHGDVIALEQALGGGTTGDAMRRCAELAGIREPKPWERKPWLERQRRRDEALRRAHDALGRWWECERGRLDAAAIGAAHDEVAEVGRWLARHPEEPVLWAWLDVAVMARERAEWAAVADAHARTVGRCGGVADGSGYP